MNNTQKFEFRIEELCLEKYADPPEDSLGELSEFEMGIRRFCFECNYEVLIQIGDERKRVFFDPDICMLLEENLPKQVLALSQGKRIEIVFAESCCVTLKFVPVGSKISCTLQEFGYSSKQKYFEFDKNQILEVFRNFLDEVMSKAVDGGYITSEEKERFLLPMPQPATR